MCLAKVDKEWDGKTYLKTPSVFGYKVYSYDKYDKTYEPNNGPSLKVNVWNTANPYINWETGRKERIKADDGNYYDAGFHIVTSLKAAQKVKQTMYSAKIVKVKFDQVTAIGIEDQFDGYIKCIIAQKMRIISEVKPRKRSKV